MSSTSTIGASLTRGADLFDLDLIKKYDKAGPRYTSYPTAPMFHDGIGNTAYAETLRRVATSDAPLSLYIHIPFCNTVCYYCGCSKIVTKQYERAQPYLELMLKEIDLVADQMADAQGDCKRPVTQLHFGGGTPTFLNDDQIRTLMTKLRSRFNFVSVDDGEFSIEIDPRECDDSTISTLQEVGLNRMSMGVQDFDAVVQKAVNRIQSKEETLKVLEDARAHGFTSMNIDLMYGLPHQTVETFDRTLDTIIEFSPDRIALFNYAHLPKMFMPQRRIDESALPSPMEKLNILEHSIHKLLDAGYVFIGMDHFAKPEDELTIAQQQGKLYRNFQGYSTMADCDLIGLGLTSIGYVGGSFFQNHKTMDEYTAAIESGEFAVFRGYTLSEEDHLRRQVIMRLMCDFALDFQAVEKDFSIDFKEHFSDALEHLKSMQTDGLVSLEDNSVRVLPAGRLLIRNIAMVFDAYLTKEALNRFSKAI
ncbi:MAG: oxygen-independent coproporphyrinogen III oxidase [Zetaproteobacteria bacterium CG_4_9_14_3_um_filter_49_83]|nr:MAG: oxygen-independent coproporphyrinogen III oxidase [Zetaproteobacteria bacterium CG1_02_49_23]PIV31387.1 MAG: oxygen-independent coproporphyrinogen III oxidase [Zetaproteobacteria bacterium CG02_land_8_20_14_3_00_50_9]PIY56591.1 MAG: oxygen-independent coproporphyrinogen III oxidase [Zetaproteobacteria bacterium CG_4_10_14_0_8_um_filter_49_80]PJA33821.1 MAG: oxygen-independent coproporphyrinogen III oxidase [Zetaproteobacteria bacterium CG_4_9_14_3_um_filter_49_83]